MRVRNPRHLLQELQSYQRSSSVFTCNCIHSSIKLQPSLDKQALLRPQNTLIISIIEWWLTMSHNWLEFFSSMKLQKCLQSSRVSPEPPSTLWWVVRSSFLLRELLLRHIRQSKRAGDVETEAGGSTGRAYYYPAARAGPPLPSWHVCVRRTERELQPRPITHQSCPQTLHLSGPLLPAPRCCCCCCHKTKCPQARFFFSFFLIF